MFGDEWTGEELSARDVDPPPPGTGDADEPRFRPEVRKISPEPQPPAEISNVVTDFLALAREKINIQMILKVSPQMGEINCKRESSWLKHRSQRIQVEKENLPLGMWIKAVM